MTDTTLIRQPGHEPTRKTTAAIIGGGTSTAISVILGWALRTYTNVEVPAEVQVAIASLITVAFAYFAKERAL